MTRGRAGTQEGSARAGTLAHSSSSPCLRGQICPVLPAVRPWAITLPLRLGFPTCKTDLIMGDGEAYMS